MLNPYMGKEIYDDKAQYCDATLSSITKKSYEGCNGVNCNSCLFDHFSWGETEFEKWNLQRKQELRANKIKRILDA